MDTSQCTCALCEALKNKTLRRVDAGDRWLVWGDGGKWVVYQRKAYARHTTVVIETDDLRIAVNKLAYGKGR